MPFMDILTALVGVVILMTIVLSLHLAESDTVEVRLLHRAAVGDREGSTVAPADRRLHPVYVVCETGGVRIGELQIPLPKSQDDRRELRDLLEAEVRLAGQGAYLFALLRPDGYAAFEQVRAAVDDLGIRFGYEPINSTWRLVE